MRNEISHFIICGIIHQFLNPSPDYDEIDDEPLAIEAPSE